MKNTELKFIKVREVRTPEYGTPGSAGIDFFVPDDFEKKIIFSGEAVLIPSGIKAKVPDGFALIAHNKSGIAVNSRLQVGADVVDSDYQGEIHIHVYNSGTQYHAAEILPKMKLIQFLLTPVEKASLVECSAIEEVFPVQTVRGEGGFGSTNVSPN